MQINLIGFVAILFFVSCSLWEYEDPSISYENEYPETYLSLILVTLFLIYTASIILSGNRMPLILYLMTLFLILLFEKRTRKYFPIFLRGPLFL